jgi:hypothetical protein
MNERPGDPETYAYEGDEKLGWICFSCQELPAQALREKLLEKADYYRDYVATLESLANGPIQVPTAKQLDAMRTQRFVNEVDAALEAADLPF